MTAIQTSNDIDDVNTKITEIVGTIKKSAWFTVVVEGIDDVKIYAPLEDLYEDAPLVVDIIPVGGRSIALGVFEKLKDTIYIKKVAFIVDQDTWVHLGKPNNYNHQHLICTTGYSVENDIFMDRQLNDLMKSIKVYHTFESNLDEYLEWYVLAIERVMNDTVLEGDTLDVHPNTYFKENKKQDLIVLRNGEFFSTQLNDEIKANYEILLRGKNLLDLAIWALNSRKLNPPKLDKAGNKITFADYNLKAIIEETAHSLRGDNLNRIFAEVQSIVDSTY